MVEVYGVAFPLVFLCSHPTRMTLTRPTGMDSWACVDSESGPPQSYKMTGILFVLEIRASWGRSRD